MHQALDDRINIAADTMTWQITGKIVYILECCIPCPEALLCIPAKEVVKSIVD